MDLDASFGHWLTLRRKALRLSRVDLARRVGCAAVTLRKIEADERRPSQQIAEKLADHLNVTHQERTRFIKVARGELCADQLMPPDLPLRPTRHTRVANLPIPPTPLIGRAQDVAAVRDELTRAEVRLLTLTGTPGIGKTRLALQAATELRDAFADGVIFIPLAPIRDPGLVISTIAQALEVSAITGRSELEGLQAYLRDRHILLVLDNFEQVLKAAPQLAALLAVAARLTLLVTSRVALHLSGEHRFAVPPLALPDMQRLTAATELASALVQYAAVELFVERAWSVAPTFALTDASALAVATICAHLDGLPLAIELAAARMALFAPQEVLARLDQRFALLTGGAVDLPTRQQTLRRAIDWSYDLLNAPEQALFRRLAVFVGGWTLEAAEAVCTTADSAHLEVLDGMGALLDQSLLQQTEGSDGAPRFTVLETIREYALERLREAREETETRRRHAAYFVALAEAISAEGGEWEYSDERTRIEYANLREVLGWCRTAGSGGAPAADLGMRLAKAIREYWAFYDLREGLRWLRELCGPAWCHGPAHLRARLLSSLGHYLLDSPYPNDHSQAAAVLEEGVWLSREIGDMWALAEACRHRGEAALRGADLAGAEVWLAESLASARAAGSPGNIAWTQLQYGVLAVAKGEAEQAVQLYEECLPVFQRLGIVAGVSYVVILYSDVLLRLGEFDRAATLLDKTLDSVRLDWGPAERRDLYDHQGQLAYAQSDLRRAAQLFVQVLRFELEEAQQFTIASDPMKLQHFLSEIAVVAAAQGHYVHATRLFSHAPERFHYYNTPNLVQAQTNTALAACRAALGEDAFAVAWAAGHALSLEQAVAEALNR